MLEWFEQHARDFFTVAGSLGIGTLFGNWISHRRSLRADQRRAAAELVPRLADHIRYWVDKHFEDLNREFNPNEEFQWSGDRFEPLLNTPALEGIAARLPPKLRNRILSLHALAHKWSNDIATTYEYRHGDLDIDGPIAIAELALASDEAQKKICKEAQCDVPDNGRSAEGISSFLAVKRKEKREYDQRQRDFQARFMERLAERSKPSASQPSPSDE